MEVSKEKRSIITYIVFGLYLLFLVWLVLFKLADSVDKIPSMRGINLIPFHYDKFSNTRFHFVEVIENVLVFIPAGFYFTLFCEKKMSSGIIACFILSFSFELLQWIFALGASDITDLITNTMGGVLGAYLFMITGKLFKDHQMKIVNTIGLLLETIFVIMLTGLMIANR